MSWWRRLLEGRRLDRELDSELRFHLEQQVADKVRAGMTAEEAQRQVRLEFGGLEQIKEDCRESRGTLWVQSVWQDVRFALRQLWKSPALSLTVVITLALGIGANTAIFTLVQGILLRSLPVADPSRLYRIGDKNTCCYYEGFQNDNGDFDLFSYDVYQQFKEVAPEFEQIAAVEASGEHFSVRRGNTPAIPLRAEYVSGNYFTTLGVGAYAGRPLGENDDKPGAAPVVVLSYQSWQSDFGGDPSLVGSSIYMDQKPFTVAGIAPPEFFGDRISPFPPKVWVPLATDPSDIGQKDMDWLYLIGRLRPGVNTGILQEKVSATLRNWLYTRPKYTEHGGAAEIPKQHVVLTPAGGGIQRLQQQTGAGLRTLMILAGVVLLIACANVANLLLARSAGKRADVALRMALGAARRRVIQQILTESILLSLIGGIAGLIVAYFGSHLILVLAFPQAVQLPVQSSPSLPVLGFAFAVSLLTGIVFGAAPAWASSHAQPAEALRGANRSTRDRSSLPQKSLVVFQVALSVVLLAAALLTARSLHNLEHQDFGLSVGNRYVVDFDLEGAGYTPDRLPAFYRQVEDRFSSLPGLANLSLTRYVPLGGNNWATCVIPLGHSAPGPNDKCFASWVRVSPGFLNSIGVPIVRGRGFSTDDPTSSRSVVLVNQTFVRQFFPNQDPIGQRFGTDATQYSGAFEIVGVFADFKMSDARGEVQPLFLRVIGQKYGYNNANLDDGENHSLFLDWLILNFDRPQPGAESLIRKTLAGIDPNLTVFHFATYESEVAGNFNQDRLIARLTSVFGVLALLLASVGIYGVMSYFVARRTAEIGVRMALGATRSGVVSIILRRALIQVLVGILLGLPAALVAGRLMTKLLYRISGSDPLALLGATGILAACALVAGFIPARRAASVDPMQALRTE